MFFLLKVMAQNLKNKGVKAFFLFLLISFPFGLGAESSYFFNSKEGLKPLDKKQNRDVQSSTPSTKAKKTSKKEVLEVEKTYLQEQQNKETSSIPIQHNQSSSSENNFTEEDNLSQDSPSEDSDIPENTISEDFAPDPEDSEEISVVDTLLEDSSWFFQDKQTKHKVGFAPIYSYDRTRGSRLGLRLFFYSPKQEGYYFGVAGSQYLKSSLSRFDLSYISDRSEKFRSESTLIYDNHYENYFGEGMQSKLSDIKKLYVHRFMASYKLFYTLPEQDAFYTGLGLEFFFRQERPQYQDDKTHFDPEGFFYLMLFTGYDTRDNWKNPKDGAFHQLSLACKPILDYSNGYCKGEGDFRFYLSLFQNTNYHPILKRSVLALRAFAGSAFFSKSSYSSAYSLGGQNDFQNLNALRAFKQNRFRGDKVYFLQTEARLPLWEEYLSGALFVELGETAVYEESFQGPVMNYGASLLAGLPPSYNMKIRFDFALGKDRYQETNYNFIVAFFQAF